MPLKIILIGSAARLEMTSQSDIDLVVVLPDDIDQKKAVKSIYQNRAPSDFPTDLLVYNESEFLQRAAVGGICAIAQAEGCIVFERSMNEPV